MESRIGKSFHKRSALQQLSKSHDFSVKQNGDSVLFSVLASNSLDKYYLCKN